MTLTRVAPGLFVLLWATGFIGSKMGAPYAEPFTFLALRFAVVAFLMALIAALWRARLPSPSQALSALWVGMLMHGVYLGAVFWAIDRGMPAGVAAVVVSLQPLTTAVLARVMLGEALPRQAM
ncbi:MAG: DMT family transporter, partial [Pseudomonadota bacterium]